MHHKHHTEALILGSSNHGETNKVFFVFTRDFGLLYASAQGVRKLSSKLRYVLQDFSYVKIDLIKGKEFWRITSASKTNLLDDLLKNKDVLRVYAHIAKLLCRLLPEQESNELLFQEVLKSLLVLEKLETKEEIDNAEIVIVLRILNNLGYIGDLDFSANLIESPFENEILFEVSKYRGQILKEINRALKESHL